MVELRKPIAGRQVAEVLTAIALLLWRVLDRSGVGLWRDWLTLVCLYWIFSVFAAERRTWTVGTVAFLTGLMALYLTGQLPQALEPWTPRP